MATSPEFSARRSAAIASIVLGGLALVIGVIIHLFYAANTSVVHTQDVIIGLEEFLYDIKDAEAAAQGFVLTGNDQFAQAQQSAARATREKLRELRELTRDNADQQKQLDEIQQRMEEKLSLGDGRITQRRRDGPNLAGLPQLFETGRPPMLRIQQLVREIETTENRLLKNERAAADRYAGITFIFLATVLLLNVALVVLVFYLMKRDLKERERASQLLQLSADRVKDLYNRAPCGYHSLDTDGKFIEINDTELSWLGYTREEVIGRLHFTDLISAEEKEKFKVNFPRFRERGSLRNREYELITKSGERLFVLINSDAVRDREGRFLHTRSSVIDISDRKQSERATEVARAYAQSIVDTVREPLVILTPDLRVKSANRAFYELCGIESVDTEGKPLRELCGGQWSVPELFYAFESAAPGRDPLVDFELSLQFPKTGPRIFLLSARQLLSPGTESPLILMAMVDVTERKRNERIHLQFRALFESLPGLYAVLKEDYTIVSASDAYLSATLRRREEIMGKHFFEVWPDDDGDNLANNAHAVRASLHRVVQHGSPDTMAIQRIDVKRPDGVFEERHWSIVNSPVFGADRKLEYIIHRVEDVTNFILQRRRHITSAGASDQRLIHAEQMEAEIFQRAQEIQSVNDQLRSANEELEAFSYSVSHDLRAPLRHIDGFADMLKAHASSSLDDKARRYLNTIAESAKRMGHLIDDLLVFSRVGRAEMRRGHVNLNALVSEVQLMLQAEAKNRQVVWKVDTLPTIRGDVAMFRQALANLLSNALKYTRRKEEAVIEIGTQQRKPGEVVVFVRDNGAGFDMRYAAKLFGVFQRLHSAAEFEGTGVGLAIVRRVVQRHGGKIWAEGEVNGGAVFYLNLPIDSQSKPDEQN